MFRDAMSRGVMGISWPRLGPLWFLTVHPYRGILFWSPWIVAALVGSLLALRGSTNRRMWGWMSLWMFCATVLANSGYYMWWGGWAMGPRLLLPMMTAVPMGLAELCRAERSRRWWRRG